MTPSKRKARVLWAVEKADGSLLPEDTSNEHASDVAAWKDGERAMAYRERGERLVEFREVLPKKQPRKGKG